MKTKLSAQKIEVGVYEDDDFIRDLHKAFQKISLTSPTPPTSPDPLTPPTPPTPPANQTRPRNPLPPSGPIIPHVKGQKVIDKYGQTLTLLGAGEFFSTVRDSSGLKFPIPTEFIFCVPLSDNGKSPEVVFPLLPGQGGRTQ